MKNLSKALIIVGVILFAIIVLYKPILGIIIFNTTRSLTESIDVTSLEISSRNAKFEAYAGKQNGTQVKQLLNLIAVCNKENQDRMIGVYAKNSKGSDNYPTSTADSTYIFNTNQNPENSTYDKIIESISRVDKTAIYNVELHYGNYVDDGLIDKINIYLCDD